jgi:hypothetical protein
MWKLVFGTAVRGVLITAISVCYLAGFFALVAPSAMADYFDLTANASASAIFRARACDQNETPDTIYLALQKNISVRNKQNVLKYGEKFFFKISETKRNAVIDKVDAELLRGETGVARELLMTWNTDFYLRFWVIKYLRQAGQSEKASQVLDGARSDSFYAGNGANLDEQLNAR